MNKRIIIPIILGFILFMELPIITFAFNVSDIEIYFLISLYFAILSLCLLVFILIYYLKKIK